MIQFNILYLYDFILLTFENLSKVLYCTIQSHNMLYCIILQSTILYYIIKSHYTILFCLYYTVLYSTILYCTLLHCIILLYTILYCIILYCIMLFHTVLYYTICSIILYYTQVGPSDRPAPAGGHPAPRCRGVWGRPRLPAGGPGGRAEPPGWLKLFRQPFDRIHGQESCSIVASASVLLPQGTTVVEAELSGAQSATAAAKRIAA